MADNTLLRGNNFYYYIPKMILESISHAKDHNRNDLAVLITKLFRSVDDRIVLQGDLQSD